MLGRFFQRPLRFQCSRIYWSSRKYRHKPRCGSDPQLPGFLTWKGPAEGKDVGQSQPAPSTSWGDGGRLFRKFQQRLMKQNTHQCPGTMLRPVTRMSGRDLPLPALFTVAQKPKNRTQEEAWSSLPLYHNTAEKTDHPPLRWMSHPNMDWVQKPT